MRVYPSGADAASACDATTPPAPGRFSTTTLWPHCRETASPSVRARTSTAPPAAYGTKIWTGLDGNGVWADAILPATSVAAAIVVAIRTHLPMVFLPIFSLVFPSHAGLPIASPSDADHVTFRTC